ncbi:MAG: type II toxin-antitoxin system HicA family toxin [Pseudomonadota bacterium]
MTPTRLVPVTAKKLLRKLKKAGYTKLHQKGSHLALKNPRSGRIVVVPMHSGDIPAGTLYNIVVKQAGLSVKEFNSL